jgi:membrane-bound ClpP family serine protease
VGGLIIFIAIKIIAKVISAHKRPAYTGAEEIVGGTALVKKALNPKGVVIFRGENWTATSESGTIEPDEEVVITKYDSLKLWVTRKT